MSHAPVAIGGSDAWGDWSRNGIRTTLQWIELEPDFPGEPTELEPCMVLSRDTRSFAPKPTWVIPLSSAFLYQHPKNCARRAVAAARHLGLEGKLDHVKIIEAIHRHIDDLVKMPPAPTFIREAAAQNIGDAKLFANGQLVTEMAVKSDGTVEH